MVSVIAPSVVIERFEHPLRAGWRVRLGKRTVTFYEEQAARAFAAQLHMRMQWLQEQAKA